MNVERIQSFSCCHCMVLTRSSVHSRMLRGAKKDPRKRVCCSLSMSYSQCTLSSTLCVFARISFGTSILCGSTAVEVCLTSVVTHSLIFFRGHKTD